MAAAASSISPPTPSMGQDDNAAYQAFHAYQWDLDKDFLGGLVLALGGYHALAPTASQADIIMHSRLFYYARVRGVTIPYIAYREWLRIQYLDSPETTRIWEWHLLRAICGHRDRLVAPAAASDSSSSTEVVAAREQAEWLRDLLETGAPAATAADGAPAWMTAAPKADLYVDRDAAATGPDQGPSDQVPYPEQFAAIIKAVQSGEKIEGIVEIPDMVARNPTTTPFGQMTRPLKPWEKAQPGQSQSPTQAESSMEHSIDSSFPEQEA